MSKGFRSPRMLSTWTVSPTLAGRAQARWGTWLYLLGLPQPLDGTRNGGSLQRVAVSLGVNPRSGVPRTQVLDSRPGEDLVGLAAWLTKPSRSPHF